MEVIPAERIQDVPKEAEGYSINVKDTVEEAERRYENKYGVKPATAWRWKNILYIPPPEGKKEQRK